MCKSVRIGHQEAVGLDRLVAMIGADAIVLAEELEPGAPLGGWLKQDGFCCLCPVDLEATARKAGYRDIGHDGYPNERVWARAEPGARQGERADG